MLNNTDFVCLFFRRMKVLIFVIFLVTFNCIKFAKSLDLTYILKKRHDHYEPNCIAEKDLLNSPIGWIYSVPKNKTDIPKTSKKRQQKKDTFHFHYTYFKLLDLYQMFLTITHVTLKTETYVRTRGYNPWKNGL